MGMTRLVRRVLKRVVPADWRPVGYLHNKVIRTTGGAVLAGPFRGLRYVDRAFCSSLLPKLLGVYERELHPIIERACGLAVDRVIDIGAAEGYYAAGFALRRPDVPVIAFEMDAAARAMAEELVRRNGLGRRVTVRGECFPADLAELTRDGVSLVVSDCEGAEARLLDPAAVPGLARSYILVETHEFVIRGVTADLRARFAPTHRIEEVVQEDRRREDFPIADWYIRRMQAHDVLGALDEARPERMRWLWMEPRAVAPAEETVR
jgi:hypothetical protein